jgi:hypothetical protein
MDQHTKDEWVRAASVSTCRITVLWSEWAEKRSDSTCTGVRCDLMVSKRWEWECMLQLQEVEDRKPPAATTWAAEFLLRAGESREFLGSWINSGAIP